MRIVFNNLSLDDNTLLIFVFLSISKAITIYKECYGNFFYFDTDMSYVQGTLILWHVYNYKSFTSHVIVKIKDK